MGPVTLAMVLALPAVALLLLGALTGMGSRRRGAGWRVTVLSAVFFPLAWIDWYVRDQP